MFSYQKVLNTKRDVTTSPITGCNYTKIFVWEDLILAKLGKPIYKIVTYNLLWQNEFEFGPKNINMKMIISFPGKVSLPLRTH